MLFLSDGNLEIVDMKDSSKESGAILIEALKSDNTMKGLEIHFIYRFLKFEWQPQASAFKPVRFNCTMSYEKLHETFTNEVRFENQALRQLQRMKFGTCQVDVPKKSITGALVYEVLNPFYIF